MTTTTRTAIRGKLKILSTIFHEQIMCDGFYKCHYPKIMLTLWGEDTPAHVPPCSAEYWENGIREVMIDIKDGFILNLEGRSERGIDEAVGLVFDEMVRKESTDKLN